MNTVKDFQRALVIMRNESKRDNCYGARRTRLNKNIRLTLADLTNARRSVREVMR